jgi:uncharacterized phage infection (PIP) family protein YhgE
MARDARIDRLEEVLERLAEAQGRTETRIGQLVEAQTRSGAQINQLTEAQARTEMRLGRLEETIVQLTEGQRQLTEAQARTEATLQQTQEGLRQLSEAQARTEATLQQTQEDLRRLARQVGGLSDAIGGDIEDIAYIVLHDGLAREFGWEIGVLERTWEPWEGEEEVDIFGQATDPARPGQTIWIVGEAKHNLTLGEVERFARRIERARRRLAGEVFAVCFAYRVRPEVRTRLRELAIPLVFSYGRMAS